MRSTTKPAGAMPVAEGATPSQSYPTGPVWAAYELPFPGACGARDAGVCFDGEAGDGANPAAAAANAAPPATTPTPTPATPATGDAELGEAGKRAIAAERKAAKEATARAEAAELELATMKTAGQSDQEKALAAARKEGETTATAGLLAIVRMGKVDTALLTAGCTNEKTRELAAGSTVFAALKVDATGKVEGLAEAVEQLKKDTPELFASAGSAGGPTRGVQTAPGTGAKTLDEAIAGHYSAKR